MALIVSVRRQESQQQQEGESAAPAPAAAPAAPVAKPEPGVLPQERLGEDEQIIADLRKEYFAKKGAEDPDAPAPKGKRATKPAVAKAPEPRAKKDTAPTSEPISTDGTADNGDTEHVWESPKHALTAVTSAIETWDTAKLAELTGKPKSFFESHGVKWAAFREQQNAVRERDRDVSRREHELNTNLAEARKEVGPALGAIKAYREGNLSKFVELVEHLTGERYDEAQRKVIKGEIALDPAVKALRKELAEERAARRQESAERDTKANETTQQAAYQRAVDAVSQELSGHPVAKLRGFQKDVLERVKLSYDPEQRTYTKSFSEAADDIVEERAEEARALGMTVSRSAPAARAEETGPTIPPRGRAAEARAPDGEEWMKRDMTDEEIIASIRRDVRSGKIKVT